MDASTDINNGIILERAVEGLPIKERVVVALRLAGYTQRECGVIIGMTRSAVGIIYKRALVLLRALIGDV